MDPILYIEVGGVIWQVFPDGTWQLLPATQAKVDGVQVVSIEPQNLDQTQPLTEPQIEAVEQQLEKVVTHYKYGRATAGKQKSSLSKEMDGICVRENWNQRAPWINKIKRNEGSRKGVMTGT